MKKLTIAIIIFILSQVFAINVCLGNSENSTSFLSGCVWMDNNENGTQELDETNMAGVIVFVERVDSGKLFTAETNSGGFFTLTELPYGYYNVWSKNAEGIATPNQIIELNEVNGANLLNLVFTPADTTTLSFNIFLPLVNN